MLDQPKIIICGFPVLLKTNTKSHQWVTSLLTIMVPPVLTQITIQKTQLDNTN